MTSTVKPQTTVIPATTLFAVITTGGSVITSAESTAFTTSVTTPTAAPGSLNGGGGDGSNPGDLTSTQKSTVIGVVVGVGGALILGGVGFVLWRLKGQKKRGTDDDDILMGGTQGGEKYSNAGSPFRSTLDQYHNPAGQVNTASNF